MFDLAISEANGNGGDLKIIGNDLTTVESIENMPYLGMFGGNVAASTTNDPVPTTSQRFDWWGNNVLMPSEQSIQFNSSVERILNTTPLTSSGRQTIEEAIKDDLKFLADSAKIEVAVSIISVDTININIRIIRTGVDQKIVTLVFQKATDGDWFLLDFNTDFNT